MKIAERQRELVEKLAIIEDPQERLGALMSRAKTWPKPDAALLTEAYRVRGCQSRVWLAPEFVSGRCYFKMECDAPMVKGLVALLCEVYEGATAAEVRDFETTIMDDLGFTRMISPTRLNGLAAVRARIRDFAAGRE